MWPYTGINVRYWLMPPTYGIFEKETVLIILTFNIKPIFNIWRYFDSKPPAMRIKHYLAQFQRNVFDFLAIAFRAQNKYLKFQNIGGLFCCGKYYSGLFTSQEKCSLSVRRAIYCRLKLPFHPICPSFCQICSFIFTQQLLMSKDFGPHETVLQRITWINQENKVFVYLLPSLYSIVLSTVWLHLSKHLFIYI